MHYSPVCHSTRHPKITFAFDLHVLGTPPALTLSQDQTLQFDIFLIFFLLKVLSLCEFKLYRVALNSLYSDFKDPDPRHRQGTYSLAALLSGTARKLPYYTRL